MNELKEVKELIKYFKSYQKYLEGDEGGYIKSFEDANHLLDIINRQRCRIRTILHQRFRGEK